MNAGSTGPSASLMITGGFPFGARTTADFRPCAPIPYAAPTPSDGGDSSSIGSKMTDSLRPLTPATFLADYVTHSHARSGDPDP